MGYLPSYWSQEEDIIMEDNDDNLNQLRHVMAANYEDSYSNSSPRQATSMASKCPMCCRPFPKVSPPREAASSSLSIYEGTPAYGPMVRPAAQPKPDRLRTNNQRDHYTATNQRIVAGSNNAHLVTSNQGNVTGRGHYTTSNKNVVLGANQRMMGTDQGNETGTNQRNFAGSEQRKIAGTGRDYYAPTANQRYDVAGYSNKNNDIAGAGQRNNGHLVTANQSNVFNQRNGDDTRISYAAAARGYHPAANQSNAAAAASAAGGAHIHNFTIQVHFNDVSSMAARQQTFAPNPGHTRPENSTDQGGDGGRVVAVNAHKETMGSPQAREISAVDDTIVDVFQRNVAGHHRISQEIEGNGIGRTRSFAEVLAQPRPKRALSSSSSKEEEEEVKVASEETQNQIKKNKPKKKKQVIM